MRALFTVHAGEFLVGEHIERNFRNVNLWLPSKDSGVDLLVTDSENRRSVSIQVKHSRDYLFSHVIRKRDDFRKLRACGWWTLSRSKIAKSKADYWAFVLQGYSAETSDFVIIQPGELLRRFDKIKKKAERLQCYFWVTNKKKCWETHSLHIDQQRDVANGVFSDGVRDFTEYLNNWGAVKPLNSR